MNLTVARYGNRTDELGIWTALTRASAQLIYATREQMAVYLIRESVIASDAQHMNYSTRSTIRIVARSAMQSLKMLRDVVVYSVSIEASDGDEAIGSFQPFVNL